MYFINLPLASPSPYSQQHWPLSAVEMSGERFYFSGCPRLAEMGTLFVWQLERFQFFRNNRISFIRLSFWLWSEKNERLTEKFCANQTIIFCLCRHEFTSKHQLHLRFSYTILPLENYEILISVRNSVD